MIINGLNQIEDDDGDYVLLYKKNITGNIFTNSPARSEIAVYGQYFTLNDALYDQAVSDKIMSLVKLVRIDPVEQ